MCNNGKVETIERDGVILSGIDVEDHGNIAVALGRRGGQVARDTGAQIVATTRFKVVPADLPGGSAHTNPP